MKTPAFFLLLATAASAASAEQGAVAPLTLDPQLYAEALQEVQGALAPSATAAPSGTPAVPQEAVGATAEATLSSAPGVEDWQAAMRDAGTELADVRLLVLLQRLNPHAPLSARAEDYAAALRLHHLMLAGNARASLVLARACREGRFESGLLFIRSDALAAVLERRAAVFQMPMVDSPEPVAPQNLPRGASS